MSSSNDCGPPEARGSNWSRKMFFLSCTLVQRIAPSSLGWPAIVGRRHQGLLHRPSQSSIAYQTPGACTCVGASEGRRASIRSRVTNCEHCRACSASSRPGRTSSCRRGGPIASKSFHTLLCAWESALGWLSRSIPICCAAAAAMLWRTPATTPGPSRLRWDTRTSNTRSAIRSSRPIGSRIFAGIDWQSRQSPAKAFDG